MTKPTRGGFILALLVSSWGAVPGTQQAHAVEAGRCPLPRIVAAYEQGLSFARAKDYPRALIALAPLADAGLGPAQRQLAEMYAAGNGVSKSLADAALWAELAFRSGDAAARRMSGDYRGDLDADARGALDQRLSVWRAGGLTCESGRIASNAATALAPLEFELEFQRRVTSEDTEEVKEALPRIIQSALDQDPFARIYLQAIETFEFHTGGQYHRFAGWHPRKAGVLRMATNYTNDDSPDYAARSILLEAKRKVFESLPDSSFADPVMRVIGGMKIYGSVYPDVNNGTYFRLIRQAFQMVEKLPASVKKYVEIVDEVHYGPLSKHYKSEGGVDAQGAYYNRSLSEPGHRIIFARRDMLYSSPLYLLQTLVHEGTHAAQDDKAFKAYVEIEKLKQRAQRVAADSAEARDIAKKIADLSDYPNRWYRGVETATGRVQDIAFECEATGVEIAAIRAVGGLPEAMESSGYIKLCPEQQRQIVAWTEDLKKARAKAK